MIDRIITRPIISLEENLKLMNHIPVVGGERREGEVPTTRPSYLESWREGVRYQSVSSLM